MQAATKTSTFRAFHNRNYSLFFCGQSISQIGTWMQRTAVAWVIYSLTHSAFMLGVAFFAQQFPSFLLSLYGGIISDRYSRYKILMVTQSASMIQAILLALLVLTNHYSVLVIMVLSAILGIINAFDVPARQPMVHDMVNDKEDLANALALNSAMVNIARMVAPALSGLVLQRWGAGVCFSFNALSFVAVITSLLLMKFPAFKPPAVKKNAITDLKEGFAYLQHTPIIGTVMLLLVCLSLFVLPYDTLIPVFAKVVFSGNAATFGYISSFIGAGAILGSLFVASLKKGIDLKNILLLAVIILGVGLLLFSRIANFPIAMVCAVIMGFGSLMPMTIGITIIQVESAPNMRGRVMSYVALAYFGMLPLGSLLIGAVSQRTSAPTTMLCQGVMAVIITAIFWRLFKKKINPAKPEY